MMSHKKGNALAINLVGARPETFYIRWKCHKRTITSFGIESYIKLIPPSSERTKRIMVSIK